MAKKRLSKSSNEYKKYGNALIKLNRNKQISDENFIILVDLLIDIGTVAVFEKLGALNKLTEFCALCKDRIKSRTRSSKASKIKLNKASKKENKMR